MHKQKLALSVIALIGLTWCPQKKAFAYQDLSDQVSCYPWATLIDGVVVDSGVDCYYDGLGSGNDWGAGGPSGGSPGGGGSGAIWRSTNGPDYSAQVNIAKNQVRTQDIGCSDLQIQRQVVAGQILKWKQTLPRDATVTVFFKDGTQKFQRKAPYASIQMFPISNCSS